MNRPGIAEGGDEQIPVFMDCGMNRGRAMALASEPMGGIGPRLTTSEGFDRAAAWGLARMKDYVLPRPIRGQDLPFSNRPRLSHCPTAKIRVEGGPNPTSQSLPTSSRFGYEIMGWGRNS